MVGREGSRATALQMRETDSNSASWRDFGAKIVHMDRIPDRLYREFPLAGRNLRSDRLHTEIGDSDTLLVFLRHLG